MAMTRVVVVIVVPSIIDNVDTPDIDVVPIIDNVDIPDVDVVVGELVCCVGEVDALVCCVAIVVKDKGIDRGEHVRGAQFIAQFRGAVEQSC